MWQKLFPPEWIPCYPSAQQLNSPVGPILLPHRLGPQRAASQSEFVSQWVRTLSKQMSANAPAGPDAASRMGSRKSLLGGHGAMPSK